MADPPRRWLKHTVPDVLQGARKRRKTDSITAQETVMNALMHPTTSSQSWVAAPASLPGDVTNEFSRPLAHPARTEMTSSQPWMRPPTVLPVNTTSTSTQPPVGTPRAEMSTSPRRTGWIVLKEVLKAVRDGSDLFLPLKAALVGVVEVMDIVDNVGEARDGFEEVAQDIDRFMSMLSQYGSEKHASPLVWRRLKLMEEELKRIKQEIESKTRRNWMSRVFESWSDVREVESVFRGLGAMLNGLQLECNLHTERVAEDLDMSKLIAQLQHVPDAGIDAQAGDECMQGTRVALLDELKVWSQDSAAPRIFWLDGMAGTGKSAIARSLCLILRRAGMFGGSFFCCRGTNRDDVKRIIPTLAVALAYQIPAYKWALLGVLKDHPDAGHDKVEIQAERLLRRPLCDAFGDVVPMLALVIDALDECADEKATSTLLTHLLQLSPHMPIKFFVTSRPDQHIRSQFDRRDARVRRILRLHDMEQSIVETDIHLYIGHRLREARYSTAASDPSYPFPPEWPICADVATLAHQAGKLFIYAFTATEYIQMMDPVGRLRRFTGLTNTTGRPMNGPLDDMYIFILNRALDPKQYEAEELNSIRKALAAILTVREYLSLDVLAKLIGTSAQRIRVMLQSLHAVVYIPPQDDAGVVSTLHASFGDFLTNPERAGQLFIDRQTGHHDLADWCIRIMSSELLHFNVSGCHSSYLSNDRQLHKTLPKQLVYACLYWSDHIVVLKDASAHLQHLHTVLSRKFLFWLEVLSILREANRTSMLIMQLLTTHRSHMTDSLLHFLQDANVFVISCREAIETSVPHIYVSALPSIHSSSRIAEEFWPEFKNVPVIMTRGICRRGNILQFIHDTSPVLAAIFSPDGTRLVSSSEDNTIRIWDANTGQALLEPLQGHRGSVTSVAFSTNGTRLVSGSNDRTIRVWDASTGRALLEPFEGHTDRINSVAFTPDGACIVSGSDDYTIRIWDASKGQELFKPLESHTKSVSSLAFSPNETRFASGSHDTTIRIWDASTGRQLLKPLEGHRDRVISVAFSQDGTRIVSGSWDKTIRIWDATTGQALLEPLQGHTGSVSSLAFSPDGAHIVSGSYDKIIHIWDASTGEALFRPLEGHIDSVTSVAFSSDGTRIVSGSYDRTIRIWDARTDQALLDSLEGHTDGINSVAFSLDGTCIASGSDDKSVRVWDARTGRALLAPLEGHTGGVSSVAISPDGARIVSGSWGETIRIWDARTGRALLKPLKGHTDGVNSVAFSLDGTRIVSGSWDKTIRVWDASTGQALLKPLTGHTDWVNSVVFSPDGVRIVSGSRDKTVRIWDASTGLALLKPLEGHTDGINSVAISPDGARIVSGSYDETIRIWDAITGQSLFKPLEGSIGGVVTSVAFSPDGTRIVSGSDDDTIHIWDARTGKELLESLVGHTGGVNSVAFSPDGTRIMSGSGDNTIRVWDTNTRQALLEPPDTHACRVDSVAWSPDENCIVSGSQDESIYRRSATSDNSHPSSAQPRIAFSPNLTRLCDSHSLDPALSVTGLHCQHHAISGDLSDYGHAFSQYIDDSFDPRSLYDGVGIVDPRDIFSFCDGWITGPRGELVLWIPEEYRVGLWWPRNVLVIGRSRVMYHLKAFVHGTDWTKCYTPR